MPRIVSDQKDPSRKDEIAVGFLGGLNTFQDETLLKDSELSDAKNIILAVDGLEPRPGTSNYGSSSGSRVLGGFGFYKSDGTREFLRFSKGVTDKLQKYVGTTPTDIGSNTYDADARMNFVQARDKVFIFNGVDNLSYYDGSTITTYTALTTPTNLAVAAQGTTGSTPYSYRVSAFNAVGETLACVSVAIANGNASINATNFNRLTWDAVTGATGYNVWGRKATGLGETYLDTVYSAVTYDDKGANDPSVTFLPPEANTTEGVVGSMGIFALQRVFVSGDPAHPSRVYFGGAGENIGNFSGSTIGGGGFDVFKNDGSQVRSILPFQGGVIIWKDNAIYKFTFTDDGLQKLEEITRSFGGISFRTCLAVENDIVFAAKKDGRLAFYSLGNQENYAGSVLRTNELSIKISSKLTEVNVAELHNSAAFYFNNIYGCAVAKNGSTVNDRVWCLDTRFGAWVYWEGITPNFFATYVDSSGNENLYYGDDASGQMKKLFEATRADAGSEIAVQWATKSFNQKLPHKYKEYFAPTFQFKNVTTSGALSGDIVVDGAIVEASFPVNQQTTGGAGVGVMTPGFHLLGDAPGGSISEGASSDVLVEVDTKQIARSIKYVFRSNSATARYKFLAAMHTYMVLDERRLESDNRVYSV
jgi:hypothetical protein